MAKDPGWEIFKSVQSGPSGGAGGKHTRAAKGGNGGCLELLIPAMILTASSSWIAVEILIS